MAQSINLILETRADRQISARSADFPDCVAVAETREEVIALMQKQLDDRLDFLRKYHEIVCFKDKLSL